MSGPTPIPRPGPGRARPLQNTRLKTATVRPIIREISAGGVVLDKIHGVYFSAILARRNRAGRLEWCLPKGHVEQHESIQAAAIREVHEETGIHASIESTLGHIDYWFHVDRNRVHKMVHHFLMRADGGTLTTHCDPDNESIDVAWAPITELPKRLAFTNEKRIVGRALNLLAQSPPSFDT